MAGEEALHRANQILDQDPEIREQLLGLASKGELNIPGVDNTVIQRVLDPPRTRTSGGFEAFGIAPREMVGMNSGVFEAIVRKVGRPPLLVKDGTYVKPPTKKLANQLEPNRSKINTVIAGTGRIEFLFHRMDWAGTGWMIDRNIAVTNRHVAELVAEANPRGGFRFRASAAGFPFKARLDYKEEFGADGSQEANLVRVKFLSANPNLDIALFEVEADFPLPSPIELADTTAAKKGLPIGIVGYPADDPDRNDPDRIRHYFGDIFDVKRFAPGEISQPSSGGILMHDATTLGGNSGSVVFDLNSGKAVGLHFAGTYLKGNFALDAQSIRKVLRGLKTVVAGIEIPKLEKRDSTHAAAFFKGRDGYRKNFLGKSKDLEVPLLGLAAFGNDVAEATGADGKKTKELRYRHFSVQYSKSRKVPIYTAVNIDGAKSRKVKRGDDQWFQDLRLPRNMQLGEKDYGRDVVDRGHMVRREDPVWGSAAEALEANFDTFHYTNAAPQHADLNQRANAWQGLENFILGSSRTEGLKVSVFTGPVLRDDDPSDPDFPNLGRIPREFWKVVAAIDADTGELYASGYVLSQGKMIQDFTEAIVFGDWNTFQVPISTIAAATRLDFGVLAKVDTMASAEPAPGEEAVMLGPKPILLSTAEMAFLGEPARPKAKRKAAGEP
ncbi:MAG: DNA/RNA non-specific endonuclease [Acidobacteria bacterium]|nr:DNA/RNA non-specific endonuclease [Acidobacteriota bacterium]